VRRVVAILLALAARAHAEPTADELAAEARALAKAGDFIGAAAKFRAAYHTDRRSEFLCDVGVAYHKAKEWPRAYLFLSRCLEHGAGLDAAFLDTVRAAVGATEGVLRAGDYTPFEITVEPDGASISVHDFAENENFIGSHLVWLPFGRHEIWVDADGYVFQHVIADAQGHDVVKLAVHLERLKQEGIFIPAGTPRTHPDDRPSPPVPRSKLPPIIATAATGAAVAIAVVGLVEASHASTRAGFALTPDAYQQSLADVDHWNHVMAAAGVVAVVGAAASTYLWIRAGSHGSHVDVEARADGATLIVRGSF
jgi:hypothetical protein